MTAILMMNDNTIYEFLLVDDFVERQVITFGSLFGEHDNILKEKRENVTLICIYLEG